MAPRIKNKGVIFNAFQQERNTGNSGRLTSEQFNREGSLESGLIRGPIHAAIIGLGGIGGHVAELLGSFSNASVLYLFDDDEIEVSNLNRTVYTHAHVERLKVDAMAEIISSRNPNVMVIPVPEKFDADCLEGLKQDQSLSSCIYRLDSGHGMPAHIFDCRDDDFKDHDLQREFGRFFLGGSGGPKMWRAAYNGFSVTIDGTPEKHPVWGAAGYTQIPSHSIPSRLVALLIVLYAFTYGSNSRAFFRGEVPVTFDSRDLIRALGMFMALNNLKGAAPQSMFNRLQKVLDSAIYSPSDAVEVFKTVIADPRTAEEMDQKNHDLRRLRKDVKLLKAKIGELKREMAKKEEDLRATKSPDLTSPEYHYSDEDGIRRISASGGPSHPERTVNVDNDRRGYRRI